ncbi:metal ABC transporter substrate-binding protein [Blastococcus goldschmidtiae]|uniref:Metal ABC transporter substrate-binding protein n=1 Tax=Blastococcus goldschmidtiae TaxID=3075546 RepID=A0ABU2K7G3_9ACTN|nr:metal ABC transporter substrate-binding protein [Blastococcus sp. DSM 46792]MDT0276125.1 metal ABC transporter substrate-binding protein [Blastococcus sp. DSM 46792]
MSTVRGPGFLAPTVMAVVSCLLVAGCSADGGTSSFDGDGRLQVVTTVAPITSIVAGIAGDRAEIIGLVPEGTNSHTFDPPPSAAVVLSEADLVFINGLKLEEPTKDLAEANMADGATLVEVGTQVLPESEYIYDFSFPREEGKPNPHLWTDPTWAIRYAAVVRDALSDADPDGEDVYQRNYEAFDAQATELSDALRADQESVPADSRELLTYHDAYAYFAETYGWEVIGAIQPESFEDPTPREVAALIDQVRAEDVSVIFGSEVFPSAVLEEIGRATSARYEDTLRDDDLPGEPGDPEHSWTGLMRYNYVTMINGLGGEASLLAALDTTPAVRDDATYPQ